MTDDHCNWSWTACAAAAVLAAALLPVSGHAQPGPQPERSAARSPSPVKKDASKKNLTTERLPEPSSEQALVA
jgi:hypothetical protein